MPPHSHPETLPQRLSWAVVLCSAPHRTVLSPALRRAHLAQTPTLQPLLCSALEPEPCRLLAYVFLHEVTAEFPACGHKWPGPDIPSRLASWIKAEDAPPVTASNFQPVEMETQSLCRAGAGLLGFTLCAAGRGGQSFCAPIPWAEVRQVFLLFRLGPSCLHTH